ncbi:MAG: hypothetical protein EBV01_14175 [Betaproteobacteria bacterium]|nr:hypothetical protein [Betaproteobacteria bacterium]NDC04223.1 hypothetical protein [Betaproteobacteria bacterium]
MGKHERAWAEKAEKDVTDGLNGIYRGSFIKKIVEAIQKSVSNEYTQAIWVGGKDYDNLGDIHLETENGLIRIELKVSRQEGVGTTKNLGSAAFTKRVSSDIKSYQQWDIEHGLKDQRYKMLQNRIGRKIKNTTDYENQLRILRDQKDQIIEQIVDITSPGQESYAKYAAEKLNMDLSKLDNLINLVLGINKLDESEQNVLYCVVKNFESEDQTIEFFDFSNLNKIVTEVKSSGKQIKFYSKDTQLMRFSVNWKNICQGGGTPSFNVWANTSFRS